MNDLAQLSPAQSQVERDVRMLIGDLHMQLIIMRAQFDAMQAAVAAVAPKGDPEQPAKGNGAARPHAVP